MTLIRVEDPRPSRWSRRERGRRLPRPRRESVETLFRVVLGPLAGSAMLASLAAREGAPFEGAILAFLTFACAASIARREARMAALLPFMRTLFEAVGPFFGALALWGVHLATGLPGLEVPNLAAAFLIATVASALPLVFYAQEGRPHPKTRIAIIGSPRSARSLARELNLAGVVRYEVIGRVAMPDEEPPRGEEEVPTLATLDDLSRVVTGYDINLLVMSGEVPRLSVFDEIARSCLGLPVRLWELSGFYEGVFGHVPIAEINASWFQYIMHPRYRASAPPSKRVIDLLIATVVGMASLPVMALVALIIRADGGPVLFKQRRIGEGGRSFTLYKLRSMKVGSAKSVQWASSDDPRITWIGRLLRKTHLDEFPQVINVIKGEMSIVGPRPEQPEFVDRLEQMIPFYQRRHLVKPGVTGWAQVRCGYAGSDVGSAWKLCHDLYYLKHRSTALDLMILGETIRTVFADRQYGVEPTGVSFILDAARVRADEPVSAAASSA